MPSIHGHDGERRHCMRRARAGGSHLDATVYVKLDRAGRDARRQPRPRPMESA